MAKDDKTVWEIFKENLDKNNVDVEDYRLYLTIRSQSILSITIFAVSVLISIFAIIATIIVSLPSNWWVTTIVALILGGLWFRLYKKINFKDIEKAIELFPKEYEEYFKWKEKNLKKK